MTFLYDIDRSSHNLLMFLLFSFLGEDDGELLFLLIMQTMMSQMTLPKRSTPNPVFNQSNILTARFSRRIAFTSRFRFLDTFFFLNNIFRFSCVFDELEMETDIGTSRHRFFATFSTILLLFFSFLL